MVNSIDLTEEIRKHKENIKRKTYTVKELAMILGVSENKARELTHAKDFPVIVLGKKRLTVISKLDDWLEGHLGIEL
ncbi:helix-turn-helix domain-containing protein [Clostridium ihumii]|uniref:helix-turn-helix domain-containing protein n=1 Tax=Clostridium ihumii TaxID=1470356 RepID=UPI0005502238|nr:helix-turn-helix domain-containing protein [Clostridium ihumii]